MVDKLEACTWCGHEGVLHCSSDAEVEWVRCVHCGRESPLAYSAAEAIKRWNAGEVRDAKPTPANGEQVERAKEVAHRIVCEFRPAGWPAKEDEIARLLMLTFSTPTEDARERVKVLEEALRPFVDLRAQRGAWGVISNALDSLAPLTVSVTKSQMLAACNALGNKETDRHG